MRVNKHAKFTSSRGHNCDSRFELAVIESLIASGAEFEYEPAPLLYRTKVRSAECGSCGSTSAYQRRTYTPDVQLADGRYIEIKGNLKPTNRAFYAAVLECNPTIKLSFVFQRDNTYGSKGKRYSDWATKHGCEWSILGVPRGWLPLRQRDEERKQRLEGDDLCKVSKPIKKNALCAKARATTGAARQSSSKTRRRRSGKPSHPAVGATSVKE